MRKFRLRRPSRAKAHFIHRGFSARLKSCPDASLPVRGIVTPLRLFHQAVKSCPDASRPVRGRVTPLGLFQQAVKSCPDAQSSCPDECRRIECLVSSKDSLLGSKSFEEPFRWRLFVAEGFGGTDSCGGGGGIEGGKERD